MPSDLTAIESEVMGLPPGHGVRLGPVAIERLLTDPAYRPSLGHPGHATHYRRGLPDGGGLHLVVIGQEAELHRDLFDPHAGPGAMMLHLATDAPTHLLGVIAAGWSVLRRLGR